LRINRRLGFCLHSGLRIIVYLHARDLRFGGFGLLLGIVRSQRVLCLALFVLFQLRVGQ
jgi:hypothetical protein